MPPMVTDDERAIRIATIAEVLYLLNITFLPVIGFVLLLVMHSKHNNDSHRLVRSHIKQAINASIWAGILMILINGLILLLNGIDNIWSWMYVIIYMTSIHSLLIILGVIAISKAQGGQLYRYPMLHKTIHDTAHNDG